MILYSKDKNRRKIILPECIVGGTNYLRCDPFTVAKKDMDTCDQIDEEVCSKGTRRKGSKRANAFDEAYCDCIGLEYENSATQLRGAANAQI